MDINKLRSITDGRTIRPDDYEPNSKNPIIANFFRNIWLADELGSGVRRLHHYVPRYSGKAPELIDGDIFRIIVPLDDEYSYDVEMDKKLDEKFGKNKTQEEIKPNLKPNLKPNGNYALNGKEIIAYIKANPQATQKEIAKAIGKSRATVQNTISALREKGLLDREGAKKKGKWIVVE